MLTDCAYNIERYCVGVDANVGNIVIFILLGLNRPFLVNKLICGHIYHCSAKFNCRYPVFSVAIHMRAINFPTQGMEISRSLSKAIHLR